MKKLMTNAEKMAYLRGYSDGYIAMREETETLIAETTEVAMRKLLHTEMALTLPTEEN